MKCCRTGFGLSDTMAYESYPISATQTPCTSLVSSSMSVTEVKREGLHDGVERIELSHETHSGAKSSLWL